MSRASVKPRPLPARAATLARPVSARPLRGSNATRAAAPATVNALDRGLALLECFTAERRVLGATELARLTGIPRPTVIRLAATLVQHRWLAAEPAGERYLLGPGMVALAQVFLSGLDVRAAARAPMQALAEACGGSVYLAVRDGLEMVLVEACRPHTSMLAARLDVGSRVPLANSALGRAYLGALDAEARAALTQGLKRLHGARWPALEAALRVPLAEFARVGICLSVGEFHPEINSVSAALVDARGEVLSFNCGGPAYHFPPERLRGEVAPALLALVREVALAIGGHVAGASS